MRSGEEGVCSAQKADPADIGETESAIGHVGTDGDEVNEKGEER